MQSVPAGAARTRTEAFVRPAARIAEPRGARLECPA